MNEPVAIVVELAHSFRPKARNLNPSPKVGGGRSRDVFEIVLRSSSMKVGLSEIDRRLLILNMA